MTASYRWPDSLPGLGVRQIVPLGRCADCEPGTPIAFSATWVAYGDARVCLLHAIRRAA